ncbi:hypothetical protein [Agreia pratensis]|nr:hypothetical protein [Agreia pratensis]
MANEDTFEIICTGRRTHKRRTLATGVLTETGFAMTTRNQDRARQRASGGDAADRHVDPEMIFFDASAPTGAVKLWCQTCGVDPRPRSSLVDKALRGIGSNKVLDFSILSAILK